MIARDSFVRTVGTALPPEAGSTWADLWERYWWVFVKGYHATEFAILLVLVFRALKDLGRSLSIVLLAAMLDEFHQTFVPGRGGVVSDVLIDAIGALVAAAFVWRIQQRDAGGTLGLPREGGTPFGVE